MLSKIIFKPVKPFVLIYRLRWQKKGKLFSSNYLYGGNPRKIFVQSHVSQCTFQNKECVLFVYMICHASRRGAGREVVITSKMLLTCTLGESFQHQACKMERDSVCLAQFTSLRVPCTHWGLLYWENKIRRKLSHI